jgi:hypothetical protein
MAAVAHRAHGPGSPAADRLAAGRAPITAADARPVAAVRLMAAADRMAVVADRMAVAADRMAVAADRMAVAAEIIVPAVIDRRCPRFVRIAN